VGGGCKGVSGVYIGEGGFVRGEKGREFVGGMYVWGDRYRSRQSHFAWNKVGFDSCPALFQKKKNFVESGWCLG